ncbi:MAG TPA: GspH/FimT family pseudopilin [Gemmatimonadales bacterium]|jgi:prepilin-type N-terminal cleavage/methylation domain-containing protein|nr:GspH/FimT family pseudopilin [Gemmatimonadales bacterium]
MQHGYTLVELVSATALLGAVTLVALPRVTATADNAAVRSAAARIVMAVDAARGAARRVGGSAQLRLADSGWIVTAYAAADTTATIAWRAASAAANGVELTGAGSPIVFGPDGLAMGASNRTLVLSRGAVVRRVVLSRLGRVTW